MSELTVEDVKKHFKDKLADPDNIRASRDLYVIHEIELLEKKLLGKVSSKMEDE
jgi:hypothetical protein